MRLRGDQHNQNLVMLICNWGTYFATHVRANFIGFAFLYYVLCVITFIIVYSFITRIKSTFFN